MRTLDLDFRSTPRASPLGWLLLLPGVVLLGALFILQQHWLEQASILQAALEAVEARLPRQGSARKVQPDQDLAAARQALARSQQPWGRLFDALEAADNADVALLEVLPDPARGKVKIHAEARNLAAMLAYHRRLEEAGGLSQVTLVDHDLLEERDEKEKGQTPVRFHISATWGGDRGNP